MRGRGHDNEAGELLLSCGAPAGSTEDETTVTLAIEERLELDDELGAFARRAPPGMGVVVVRRGPNEGSRFSLERETTTVGRHPDSDIFLDDITVSRFVMPLPSRPRTPSQANVMPARSTAPT